MYRSITIEHLLSKFVESDHFVTTGTIDRASIDKKKVYPSFTPRLLSVEKIDRPEATSDELTRTIIGAENDNREHSVSSKKNRLLP